MKFDSMNAAEPYRPLARSLMNVARSSRKLGTYATAMKDIKADPKNIALVMGIMSDWSVFKRSHLN